MGGEEGVDVEGVLEANSENWVVGCLGDAGACPVSAEWGSALCHV